MAAGLDGIRNELDPPPPADVDVGRLSAAEAQARGLAFLPASLPEALDAFEADPVLTDALGPGDQRGAPQGETRRARRLRSRGASVGACHLPGDILTPAPGTATVRQTRQMDWIDPDEPAACEIVNADGRSRVIFTCDHANARIPRRLGTLGVGRADLERHIAWDIGAAPVARRLSGLLDAPLGPHRLFAPGGRLQPAAVRTGRLRHPQRGRRHPRQRGARRGRSDDHEQAASTGPFTMRSTRS